MNTILIALDGGGTHTRCAAFDPSGKKLFNAEDGPSNHLVIDSKDALASLVDCISRVLRGCGVTPDRVAGISAGLSGVDLDGEGMAEAQEALRNMGFKDSIISADIVTAHAGALGGSPGIVALAGTGSAFFGIAADGRRARAGGWGPAFGDEGGAFWIGRKILQAAASAYDGRQPHTRLLELACNALGIHDFPETLHCIYRSHRQASLIASLAHAADAAAQAGDQAARQILEQAGEELARGVGAVLRVLACDVSSSCVSWEGTVIRNSAIVRERFCSALTRGFPQVSLVPPRFDPLYGAYLIGCKSLGWEPQFA